MDRQTSFPALMVTRLQIRLIGASLEVFSDRVSDIQVLVSGDDHDVQTLKVTCDDHGLTIEQPVTSIPRNPLASRWMQVTIRVPRDWQGSVSARTTSGLMKLRGLRGADVAAETTSGVLLLQQLSVLKLTARTNTGALCCTEAEADAAALSTVTGSIEATGTRLRRCSVHTITGAVRVQAGEMFEDFSGRSVSGSFAVEVPVRVCDATLMSTSGKIRTNGVSIQDGAPRVHVVSVSGGLNIDYRA